MKKFYLFILLLPFFFVSCEIKPYADFMPSSDEVDAGDAVMFSNHSADAVSFHWDFGDGNWSEEYDPTHIYSQPGTYIVSLTAYSRSHRASQYSRTVTVLYPTTLVITVLEYYQQYPVANASVILYPSLNDWNSMTNQVIDGYTDSNGEVFFSHLPAINYFLDVWEANHNNYALASEDVNFISTGVLVPHEVNEFIAYVDYVPSGTKSRSLHTITGSSNGPRFLKKLVKAK